jgi:threonine dehydrogenase-like Zn-dependent dehydrogenase
MKAVTWHGRRDMRVEEVPDPNIQQPDDAIVKITSTGLCGSDLHLFETLGPFMTPGDIVGHEPMGEVQEVGAGVSDLNVGDRVVLPFNVSCGHCWMCDQELYSQCETTQNVEYGTGASFFGYSKLYGQVPGGQAEFLRVPFANFMPIKVPEGPADERFLFLSPSHRVAGGRLRRRSQGRHAPRPRPRSDRRHGGPDRPDPRPPGDRGGPGPRAARAGPHLRRGGARPERGGRRRRRGA